MKNMGCYVLRSCGVVGLGFPNHTQSNEVGSLDR